MNIIMISTADVPARATYLAHVLELGHKPGVLSGREIRGSARRHSSYWRMRMRATQIAAQHGIKRGKALINGRWSAVWMRGEDCVQIVLV